jgi:microcystin-dependent protein
MMSALETTVIRNPSSTADNLTLNPDGTVTFYSPSSGGAAPGAVVYYAMNNAPIGWLACDGASYPTATYKNLYAAIGNAFGGDATNFNVPDLRGYFMRSWDNGRGVDPSRAFGSTQDDAFESHSHSASDSGHTHTQNLGGGISTSPNAPGTYVIGDANNSTTQVGYANVSIGSTGGTENRPKNIALLACIKT